MNHRRLICTAGVILAAAVLTAFAGCSGNNDPAEEESSEIKTSSQESTESRVQKKIHTISSSLKSPLDMDVWGAAAKYSTSDQKYYNVPTKVISAEYGRGAEKKIQAALKKNPAGYEYTTPAKDQKWALIGYTISLDGFALDENGADASLTSFVSAEDGGYLRQGGKDVTSVTMNLFEDKYYYEGQAEGYIAVLIPADCKKFILTLGEYNETQAFYLIENK